MPSSETKNPPTEGSSKDGTTGGITRVAKACEPCRARKTRCDIATQAVCSECLKRGQADECTIRDRARPKRSSTAASSTRPKKIARSSSPEGRQDQPSASKQEQTVSFGPSPPVVEESEESSTHGARALARSAPSSAVSMVERLLVEQARKLFDLELQVALPSENVFSTRAANITLAELGLKPGDSASLQQAHLWINTHFHAIHHNTPFLHLPQVLAVATRVFGPDAGLDPVTNPSDGGASRNRDGASNGPGADNLALLYAVLALGSLRELTYDSEAKQYRTLDQAVPPSASGTPRSSFRTGHAAQALFRLAQDELEHLESPSETAVQALFLMHTFVSNTSMSRRSRDYVARAVMMAHEIGLNRRLPVHAISSGGQGAKPSGRDRYAARRRAILYLYVYFSDVYLSALDNHTPLIKRYDYDHDVFEPIDHTVNSGIDTPSGTPLPGLRAFVDLVTTIGSVLEQLHQGYYASSMRSHGLMETSSETARASLCVLVLRLEAEMDALRARLGDQTFSVNLEDAPDTLPNPLRRTAVAGSLLRQMHFNWSRIALRAPFLEEPLLRHSSLSICASSAKSILHFHRLVIDAALLNLPWMQLRRVSISVYLIFLALWAGEMPHAAAALSVNNSLDVLQVIGTRWKSAEMVAKNVRLLAQRSGLSIRPPREALPQSLPAGTSPASASRIPVPPQDAPKASSTVDDFMPAWPFMTMPGLEEMLAGNGPPGATVSASALENSIPYTSLDPDEAHDATQLQMDLAAIGADSDLLSNWMALQHAPW